MHEIKERQVPVAMGASLRWVPSPVREQKFLENTRCGRGQIAGRSSNIQIQSKGYIHRTLQRCRFPDLTHLWLEESTSEAVWGVICNSIFGCNCLKDHKQ
ncbi:unnamed protein product [Ilex paraguariensis]|uniref:Uncharacterized protein n=1 Tax=Ilex paraguariensis TaxID=185542 RepID=A0ABC8SLK9_9AQUA